MPDIANFDLVRADEKSARFLNVSIRVAGSLLLLTGFISRPFPSSPQRDVDQLSLAPQFQPSPHAST